LLVADIVDRIIISMRVISLVVALLPVATSFSVPKTAPVTTHRLSSNSNSNFALNAEVNGANGGSSEKKKVIVLGGDGFCGWPTSLFLSDQGHDVVIVDNLSRRKIDLDLGCDSLTPITSPEVR
jgi:UDP-sulfoquinovose synthase